MYFKMEYKLYLMLDIQNTQKIWAKFIRRILVICANSQKCDISHFS